MTTRKIARSHKLRAFLLVVSAILLFGCASKQEVKADDKPEPLTREALLSAKIRCSEQGWKYLKENYFPTKGFRPVGQRFNYNQKLNTCLYWSGEIDVAAKYQTESIVDILENNTLAQYGRNIDRSDEDS